MDRVSAFFAGLGEELRSKGLNRFVAEPPTRTSAVLKLTNACDSECAYCDSWKDKPEQELPLAWITDLAEDLSGFDHSRAVLSGGEPTSSREFVQTLSRLACATIPTVVITNGLTAQADSDWVNQVDELTFSIDTTCPHTYRRLRGVDGLEKAMGNLSTAIKRSRAAGGHPLVSVNIVLTSLALKELADTVACLTGMGVHRLYFMQCETHLTGPRSLSPSVAEVGQFMNTGYPKVRASLKSGGIPMPRWAIGCQTGSSARPDSACMVPWLQAVVRPNGDVYPCCRLGDDGKEERRDARYRLGNLGDARFKTIIQGAWAQSVRLAILHAPPEACSSCELGRICSFESLSSQNKEGSVEGCWRTLDHSEYLRV